MEIIRPPLTHIREDELLRYAGVRDHSFSPAMIKTAVQEVLCLAQPQGVWRLYPYRADCGLLCGDPALKLEGEGIRNHLSQAVQAAILAATIGEEVEKAISHRFQRGEYTAALLLDAAATTAVEQTVDSLNRLIDKQGRVKGYQLTSRFSPGYGNWSVTVQPKILTLCQGSAIGIRTTESHMLIPRKSVTAVIGWVPQQHGPEPVKPTSSCQSCHQIHCIARKMRASSDNENGQ
ncbi:hypothetical protein [Acetonema longum]|uniref:Vitamin B12 dependent methionine synthase activation region n=1 Tax=Acetonema longum DSM 6540 TaxID=1009370 RepID=F7NIH0_9FIRM|nr:hypothetical protein [Acetonema longum]EGO64200.1 Vitamin B12 dependent methionine synthase activation region [Acetonema longum DSM 6540]